MAGERIEATWAVPRTVVLTSGVGHGLTEHEAFDRALLNAGVGDFNISKLSSIIPVGAVVLTREEGEDQIKKLVKGTILPAVFIVATSQEKDQQISAALAVGIPQDKEMSGIIFESAKIGQGGAAQEATLLVHRALEYRGIKEFSTMVISAETSVGDETACVVSVAAMLP